MAINLHIKLCKPGEDYYECILSENLILNFPITAADARRAIQIYGPDVFYLNGKMTHQKSEAIPSFVPVSLSNYILKRHKNIRLSADFFYVQGYLFSHTYPPTIQLRTSKNGNQQGKTDNFILHKQCDQHVR